MSKLLKKTYYITQSMQNWLMCLIVCICSCVSCVHVRLSDLMFTSYGYRYYKLAQETFAAKGASDRFSGLCDPVLTISFLEEEETKPAIVLFWQKGKLRLF